MSGKSLNFNLVTAFPEYFEATLKLGLIGKAVEASLISYQALQLRSFAEDQHQTIDDSPYGGGDGMVLKAPVLMKALGSIPQGQRGRVICLSPQGKKFDDKMARELSKESNITFFCGRYSGFDNRFITLSGCEEVSIGDFVLNGGEVAALTMIEAISRFIPGVLGNTDSAEIDSFAKGLLEGPIFTRPESFQDSNVPKIFMSGDHAKISEARNSLALLFTFLRRRDLLSDQRAPEVLSAAKQIKALGDEQLTAMGLGSDQLDKVITECSALTSGNKA